MTSTSGEAHTHSSSYHPHWVVWTLLIKMTDYHYQLCPNHDNYKPNQLKVEETLSSSLQHGDEQMANPVPKKHNSLTK